ncbi:hypothetical protein ACHHYP_20533 [Achlya hypogyna]|uniref:Winged helix-turn helix domain-containing protein n=1 Tax=Achlya hypogyna TaxID=1202772 RepID=A0A1V9YJH6_ACHHY|nr:hypothetical protein ACHHYP_20533 [Achlya hypogyna]
MAHLTQRHVLAPCEKVLIVNAHAYFMAQERRGAGGPQVRARVAACLGFGEATVARVMAEWHAHHDPTSHHEPQTGWPKTHVLPEAAHTKSTTSSPVTAAIIRTELERRCEIEISLKTMQRVLKRQGYKYLKGQQRHTMAETAANVVFRARYLRAKLANRSARNEPIVPEVYLDESFCHLHHVASRSWLDHTRTRYGPSGKGPRYYIVGAGTQHQTCT